MHQTKKKSSKQEWSIKARENLNLSRNLEEHAMPKRLCCAYGCASSMNEDRFAIKDASNDKNRENKHGQLIGFFYRTIFSK